jgi:hypothetical protein
MQEHTFELANKKLEKTCDKCGHLPVCSIFRAFAPLIRHEFEENPPVDPTHLAKICEFFGLDLGDAL